MIEKLKSLIFSEKFGEVVRFGIVGVLATLIQYVFYYLFLQIEFNATVSYTISYLISWFANFFLSAKFTFKKKATAKKGVSFALSHAINYGLQVVCLNVFIALGVPDELAPIPVYCVCIPLNFLLVRFVFNSKKL